MAEVLIMTCLEKSVIDKWTALLEAVVNQLQRSTYSLDFHLSTLLWVQTASGLAQHEVTDDGKIHHLRCEVIVKRIYNQLKRWDRDLQRQAPAK
jgi:uncharacterized membrane protein YciS (DUF1049 family)